MEISELYKKFSEAEGSQHIASEFAIKKLLEIINFFKIKNILEIGLGIGSISGIILAQKQKINLNYSGTENNIYCSEQLLKNLGSKAKKLDIYTEINKINKSDFFDLIIIDGKDSDLYKVQKLIKNRGILAIEGDRMNQHEHILKLFPKNSYVHSISLKKNKSYSPFNSKSWQGGVKFIFINPDLQQMAWIIKERIFTKGKYFLRKRQS